LEVVEVFYDKAISGKSAANRPGLQAAITKAIRIKGVLLCYSLSRFARNLRETLHLADMLKTKGAHLSCVKEKFDTSDAQGKFVFHLFAALQEMEREQIATRTRDAMLTHQANGRKMSSKPPYGWMIDPENSDRIIKDEAEQRTMRQLSIWRMAGYSLRAISDKANAAGIKYHTKMYGSQKHNNWTDIRVFKVLKRAKYDGILKTPEKNAVQDAPQSTISD
jgi:site-specific DNA recombinase